MTAAEKKGKDKTTVFNASESVRKEQQALSAGIRNCFYADYEYYSGIRLISIFQGHIFRP